LPKLEASQDQEIGFSYRNTSAIYTYKTRDPPSSEPHFWSIY
jgi:hypothetical protein